ncbi:flagellar export chaperone FliS [Pseudobacillus sp. 179-B 2D1 NHS]|uniref:flagellar export chaperone FliS n=1 Tax=Pseudobacillus sp. 179-B 2D1 NHS TaxID=3374292 RepID=UPI00387A7F5E
MKEKRNVQKLYEQMSILTAPSEKLILGLLNGALAALDEAKTAIARKEWALQNESLQKAQDCLLQLIMFFNTAEEEGRRLIALYDFLNRKLIRANMDNDSQLLEEVAVFLHRQKEDWQTALNNRRKRYTGNQA